MFRGNVLFDGLLSVWEYRQTIVSMTVLNLKARHAGSMLGMLWLVLYPVLFLGLYATVYIFIFKIRLGVMSPYEYVLMILIGLVPFLNFTDSLGMGTSCVVSNANLVKNTLFPIEMTPVVTVVSSQLIQVIGFSVLTTIYLYKGTLGFNFIFVFLMWFLQVLFSIGLLWLLSALNVFFRDIGNIIPVVILMLMMISPIAYTEDMVPEGMRSFLHFNPLYYMIIFYQKVFLYDVVDYRLLLIFSFISICTFMIGFKVFSKLKGIFSDYI